MKEIKLVMTLLVRDEQDILENNIDFHLSQGVDHFIITDNLSTDATPDIIERYRKAGLATVINETDDNYNQRAWVSRMAHQATTLPIKADWIIHSDADEFWIPDTGTLKYYFAALPEEVNIASIERHDFVSIRDDTRAWHEKMTYRKTASLNVSGNPIPPVVAHRAHPDVKIHQGNHTMVGMPHPVTATDGMEVLHFPIRSLAQYENKIRLGGAAYHRNKELPVGTGKRWRSQFNELEDKGTLIDYYNEQSANANEIERLLITNQVRIDTRIAEYVSDKNSTPTNKLLSGTCH